MGYEDFINYMADGLQAEFGTELDVQRQVLMRNNSEEHMGLSMNTPGSNVAPVIDLTYAWQSHQNGTDAEIILREMIASYREQMHRIPTFPTTLSDFSEARSYLIVKLIHHDKNAGLLEYTPHRDFMDLAVVYCLFFESVNHCLASAVISYDNMKAWNVSEEELHAAAMENAVRLLPPSLSSMDQLVCEISLDGIIENSSPYEAGTPTHMNIAQQPLPAPMYILTNRKKYLGAASLLYPQILERFQLYIRGGFYLLPSSIHEVILIPKKTGIDPLYLRNMVRDINRISTPTEEILSDEIYEYIPGKGLRLFD